MSKTQAYLYRAYKYTANYKSAFQYSAMEVTRERRTVQCCRHLWLSFGGAISPPRLNPCDLRQAAYTSSSMCEGTQYSSHSLVSVIYSDLCN